MKQIFGLFPVESEIDVYVDMLNQVMDMRAKGKEKSALLAVNITQSLPRKQFSKNLFYVKAAVLYIQKWTKTHTPKYDVYIFAGYFFSLGKDQHS